MNVPVGDQLMPPSIEYSVAPLPAVVVTVIEPSVNPQSLGGTVTTVSMTGAILSINISFGALATQVPSAFLTRISKVPPVKPINILDACQLKPPSIEYSNELPADELARTVIVPSADPQSVGLDDDTEIIVGATLSISISVEPKTIQVISALRAAIS